VKTFIRISIGLIITACGLLILANSANMSFQGYESHFENLTGAGFIGVGISGLAFFCAAAISIASRLGMKDVAIIAAIMAAVCFGGDVYGNHLATGGEVETERAEALVANAAYHEANTALTLTRERLATAKAELAIVAGADIVAAQRLLKAKGLYKGKIDGVSGGQTESAIDAFSLELRTDIDQLSISEASQSNIVSHGVTELPGKHEGVFAFIIAVLLSALSMAASAIGLPLVIGKKIDGEQELQALEQTMDDFEGEVVDFIKWLDVERDAQKTA